MPTRASIASLAILTMLFAVGCAQTPTSSTGRWTHLDYQLSYNLPLQDRATLSQPLPESELQTLTPKIYVVSDNQRHELLGSGVDWFRNSFADKYISSVAIRPPQLDLFGQDLLREMIAMTDGFVLHLGDACDVSNTGEFGRFAWDMQQSPGGWVMTPGNHDGYFYGNSSRKRESLIREWNESAESYEFGDTSFTSRAMQKDRYVSYYLASLILQNQVWSGPLAQSLGAEVEQRYRQWTSGQTDEPLTFSRYWQELEALESRIYSFADSLRDRT